MKISLTRDQIGHLMDEIDIDGHLESDFAEDRVIGAKLQRIYKKLHTAYNEDKNNA